MSREHDGQTGGRAADDQAADDRAAADAVYAQIVARAPEHDIDPTLERVRMVCDLLGNPQRAYRVVHLTGTNGKTSTARMVERLLRELGLRTGRFTSPHLTRANERIAIDGEPISDARFVETWEDVRPYVEIVDASHGRLSFFEVFTVMAFAAFADAPVDVAVVEVGLGGRWDATNVADGQVAVITPVAMDHERYLGTSLASIAAEKAGIVKPGSTLVLAAQEPVVEQVVLAHAAEVRPGGGGGRVVREGVDIEVLDRVPAVGGQLLTLRGLGGVYTEVFVPLFGEHQAHNALLALVATEALVTGGAALSADVVEQAFADVSSPGRLEVVRSSPTVLVDGAHNPASARVLAAAVDDAFALTRVVGVVGVMADKDVEGILGELEPLLAEIVVTWAGGERAMDPDDLAEVARDVFGPDRVHVEPRLDDALDLAVQRAEGEVDRGSAVLVTGSILLVAQARVLLGRP